MDALLSLPILSVLLLPSITSYSTSLNLLFFYLTWSTLILSHSALNVEFFGTLLIRVVFYLIPSLLFLLFDCVTPSLAVNIKEHGEAAIATSSDHGRGKWWRVALLSAFNVVFGVVFQVIIEWFFTKVLHVRSVLRISTSLPLPWGLAKDIVRGLFVREFLSYLLHRYILHSKSSPLQKLHTSYYHGLPVPYSLAAHYDHPLAYLVRVVLPVYIPAALFRFHILTYHLFLLLVSIEELFAYSGYNLLPSGFIMGGIARRHERHLLASGTGNFSAYGLVDLLTGTVIGSDVIEDLREEADKREVQKKAKSRVRQVRKRVEER